MKPKTSSLGPRVRELRKERRLTQENLAVVLGISQGHLSQLERGNTSFLAEQLITILKHFNVSLDDIAPEKASAGSQIQNALARQGAAHLAESENILPSDRLKTALAVIREALVSADSARQIAAVATVLVNHAGQINFNRLRGEFAELGLENRFAWAVESTLEALRRENSQVLPREWRVKYRRAEVIIESIYTPADVIRLKPRFPQQPPQFDVLDPEIASRETLQEVIERLSPIARKWRIATGIEVDDFVKALRGARGAD